MGQPGARRRLRSEAREARRQAISRGDRPQGAAAALLERFPITWNHVIDKESLKSKMLEQVLIEKVCQLFRNRLWVEENDDAPLHDCACFKRCAAFPGNARRRIFDDGRRPLAGRI
ncbi:hypothetical protein D1O30_14005 [Methylocystis hirsuta]|uniref:Uncharacterized protein n=1 Tax=Methylocystis hirsuta TaxID=369798 RepID=A0A3M9XUI5_9HYPH|nr:hypothetical protein D1O30_14005 [Methylocystis hirsuta]